MPGARRTRSLHAPHPLFGSTTRVPNPRREGGVTIGPPASIQRKLSLSAVQDQAISTRPSTADSSGFPRVEFSVRHFEPLDQAVR
jgi:hypothetical protein